nr:hypothetical protein [Streptomyces sp. 846.5]
MTLQTHKTLISLISGLGWTVGVTLLWQLRSSWSATLPWTAGMLVLTAVSVAWTWRTYGNPAKVAQMQAVKDERRMRKNRRQAL